MQRFGRTHRMNISKEKLERKLEHLREELRTCDELAVKFASGRMTVYENGVAIPAEEVSKRYKHYAKHLQEMIEIYSEQLAK